MLDKNEVLNQSKKAYAAWCKLWRHNSLVVKNEIHDKLPMHMFMNYGLGKQCVLVSMGGSLEDEIETLREYQGKVDIICVDKAFGELVKRGIQPDFCVVADAQISFESYLEPYLEASRNTVMVANVNSNPLWGLNWRGAKTYYVNKDNIESEKEFSTISGVTDMIPAGSNVSNAMTIYATEVFNYDRYILAGFDFSWPIDGRFYAFADGNEKTGAKSVLLNQLRATDKDGNMVACSENLWFSARWLDSWCKYKGVHKFVNCSQGIMKTVEFSDLKQELTNIKQYKRQLTYQEHVSVNKRKLNINSPQAYVEAKQILNSDNVNVIDGHIEFQLPEDQAMQFSQDTKGAPPNVPEQMKQQTA